MPWGHTVPWVPIKSRRSLNENNTTHELHRADTNTGCPAGEKWQWQAQGAWFLVYLLLNTGPKAAVVRDHTFKTTVLPTPKDGWLFLLGDKGVFSLLVCTNKENSGVLLWRRHCIQWAMVAFQQTFSILPLRDEGSTLTLYIHRALSHLLCRSPFFRCSCSLQSRWEADHFHSPVCFAIISHRLCLKRWGPTTVGNESCKATLPLFVWRRNNTPGDAEKFNFGILEVT